MRHWPPCPTFNFGGDVPAAKFMLESKQIGFRYLVSKNVCHGVLYDDAFAARVAALSQQTAGIELVHKVRQPLPSKRWWCPV
jgi:pyrimidine-specific ribonucleoside hydrolase